MAPLDVISVKELDQLARESATRVRGRALDERDARAGTRESLEAGLVLLRQLRILH